MRRRSFLAAALAGLAAPRPVRAAARQRTTGLHYNFKNGVLAVSVGLQDLFWRKDIERLKSGFATRVLIRVAVVRSDNRVVSATFRQTEIVYDLWDENYKLRRTDPGRPPVLLEAASAREAVELGTLLIQFPVARLEMLMPGVSYRISFRGDLNPLSEDVLQDVRRWLAPRPGSGRQGPGDLFFGSFVSIFVNPQIEESERQVVFFSQPFLGLDPAALPP